MHETSKVGLSPLSKLKLLIIKGGIGIIGNIKTRNISFGSMKSHDGSMEDLFIIESDVLQFLLDCSTCIQLFWVFVAACVMVIHNLFWNYIHLYFIIIELDLTALDNGCSNVIAHAYVTLLVICPNPLDAWI